MSDFPTSDMVLTHILVVSDIAKSKNFYKNVLGAEVFREYGGNSVVLNFNGSWLLLVTGGGPSKDKPDITFTTPDDFNRVSHSVTIRVMDCIKSYEVLKGRGANFLSPPVEWGAEIRCFFTDPDSHLFEISQTK
jgi:catechol 2,3-dioxygenase-like lactoylglutathione lyase family enzyme